MTALSSVLIIEPNVRLTTPYYYLDRSTTMTRVPTVARGLKAIHRHMPELIFLSASFNPEACMLFLTTLHKLKQPHLIPLIIVVDLSHRLNFIPGTTWGSRIGVLDCFASNREFESTLDRILHPWVQALY